MPAYFKLDDILCLKHDRRVYPDNTISLDAQKYQILPDRYRANYSRARVEVREHLDGKMTISYKGRNLKHKKITRTTQKQRQEATKREALRQGDISMLQLQGRAAALTPADSYVMVITQDCREFKDIPEHMAPTGSKSPENSCLARSQEKELL